jgi:hypothetical protein
MMRTSRWHGLRAGALMAASLALAPAVSAHSASDAYLTLETLPDQPDVVRGQWDIALRDLDFVLTLDDDGNGAITWGELRRHQDAIARYALERLKLSADGQGCTLRLTRQMVANHADGAYAALFFEARCPARPMRLTLDYRLFFDIDPSHRAIVVVRTGNDTATAVLAPEHARIDIGVPKAAAASTPGR